MVKIWLDDVRPMPADYDIHCLTVGKAVLMWLVHCEESVLIDFDHDLGDNTDNGHTLASIIERLSTLGIKPPDFLIHSDNSVGAATIKAAMLRAQALYEVTCRQDSNSKKN